MKRWALFFLCVMLALGFAALSVWQWERRSWKLDLIARVDARIHAAPIALTSLKGWPRPNLADDEYRRVRVAGHFLNSKTTLVDALTERGPGAWVLTPLETLAGVVLVNRGFVPPDHFHDFDRKDGRVVLVGLVRFSEPEGRFLRPNNPAADKWYSRDVVAIAAARKVDVIAPVFVDAEGIAGNAYPVGGMTVVQFRNMHLIYALTWFALAGLATFGAWRLLRGDEQAR